ISDRPARESERFGRPVQRQMVALHPAAESRRRHRFARLLVRPAPELRGAEIDSATWPFDGPAVLREVDAIENLGIAERRQRGAPGDDRAEIDLRPPSVIPGEDEDGAVARDRTLQPADAHCPSPEYSAHLRSSSGRFSAAQSNPSRRSIRPLDAITSSVSIRTCAAPSRPRTWKCGGL